MRWFGIDDLSPEDTAALAARLQAMGLAAGMEGLFWLPVPAGLLTECQRAHQSSCGPHVMALELEENALRMELLVRARGRLRCDCVGYAGVELRNHMLAWLDGLLAGLGIRPA